MRKLTRDAFQAWLDQFTAYSVKIPSMPGETFSREMIYQDHSSMTEVPYLPNSNVFLRLTKRDDLEYASGTTTLDRLLEQGAELCYTPRSVGDALSDRDG